MWLVLVSLYIISVCGRSNIRLCIGSIDLTARLYKLPVVINVTEVTHCLGKSYF